MYVQERNQIQTRRIVVFIETKFSSQDVRDVTKEWLVNRQKVNNQEIRNVAEQEGQANIQNVQSPKQTVGTIKSENQTNQAGNRQTRKSRNKGVSPTESQITAVLGQCSDGELLYRVILLYTVESNILSGVGEVRLG